MSLINRDNLEKDMKADPTLLSLSPEEFKTELDKRSEELEQSVRDAVRKGSFTISLTEPVPYALNQYTPESVRSDPQ